MSSLFRNSSPGALTREQAVALEKKRAAERRKAAELAKQGRGGDTEVAHVTLREIVLPKALQTRTVLGAIRQAAVEANIPLNRLRIGSGANSINPETGMPEFTFGFPDEGNANLFLPTHRFWLKAQIALHSWEKPFVTDAMKNGIKDTLRGIANGALPDAQIDGIYNQLLDNIPRSDALKLSPLDPGQSPMALTPEQRSIIQDQISRLRPDDRKSVQDQYDEMTKSGRITCPTCGN